MCEVLIARMNSSPYYSAFSTIIFLDEISSRTLTGVCHDHLEGIERENYLDFSAIYLIEKSCS